jgi:hypothetical protein
MIQDISITCTHIKHFPEDLRKAASTSILSIRLPYASNMSMASSSRLILVSYALPVRRLEYRIMRKSYSTAELAARDCLKNTPQEQATYTVTETCNQGVFEIQTRHKKSIPLSRRFCNQGLSEFDTPYEEDQSASQKHDGHSSTSQCVVTQNGSILEYMR